MKANSNNGLSPTMVLRYLNSQLGSSVQTLELSSKDLMEVVFQQSLQTFSQYFPFKPMCTLTNSDRVSNEKYTEYRIPNPNNLQILSIHKYFFGTMGMFASGWMAPYLTNPVDAQLMSDRASMFMTPELIDFWPPNRIIIKQNYYTMAGDLTVQFKAVHPKHLKTIEANLRDEFLHLCLYDVLISLYPIRHRFQSITTPYGTLEPFFEMVDSAQASREALLQNWRQNYLQSGEEKKIWIA